MLKSEARNFFLEKRKLVSAKEKAVWEDLILIGFQKISLPSINNIFTYAAMEDKHEISTDNIVSYLEFKNPHLQVAYPKIDFKTCLMDAMLVNNETVFTKNSYGVAEPLSIEIISPAHIDIVLVPMLCCDENGYRVGFGKGFYDRYLANVAQRCIKIGLSYFEPIDKIEDRNEFDVPLSYCVTPQRVYEF